MSFFFGQPKSQAAQQPALSGIPIQTSVYGKCIPVVYGTRRVSGNLIWYGDFGTLAQRLLAGKGGIFDGGKGDGERADIYLASFAFAVSEGPIAGFTGKVWQSKAITTTAALGFSTFTGTYPQSAWGHLTTNHPGDALGYNGIAYAAVANYNLGQSAQLPNHNFEVSGRLIDEAISETDAEASAVITDILSNANFGVGFPSARIGSLSVYRSYCIATGLLISPIYDEQRTAAEIIDEIALVTNSAPVWSSGVLTMVPYGDETITANGETYTAPSAPLYDLTDDDFKPAKGVDPVRVRRRRPADVLNALKVEYLNRANDYNTEPVEAKDQASIDSYGLRQDKVRQQHLIAVGDVARLSAQLQLQRQAIPNEYEFELDQRYVLLDPMDIVSLTDSALGLDHAWVRIKQVEEGDDGTLSFLAEEYLAGSGAAAAYSFQQGSGFVADYAVDPGDVTAPIFIEPPNALSGAWEVWIAVAGGADWGGCQVWVSTDGDSYAFAGEVTGKSRTGELTDALPALSPVVSEATLDEVNTLSVDLSESGGELASGTETDAQLRNTLCWVDGEFISYRDADLTGANAYDLAYLVRGGFGTLTGAHADGTRFVRIDRSVFKFAYAADRIGQTLHFKFPSFNLYKGGLQSLAEVDAYEHSILGTGFPAAEGSVVQVSLATGVQDSIDLGVRAARALDPYVPTHSAAGPLVSSAIHAKIDRISASLLRHTLKIRQSEQMVREAGLKLDPDSGRAVLWTLQETRSQLNLVSIELDAVTATLTSKVSITEVNQAIAAATVGFDPAYREDFNNVNGGWTATGCTLTQGSTYIEVELTGSGEHYLTSPVISADAGAYRFIGVRITQLDESGFGVSARWGAAFANALSFLAPTDPQATNTLRLYVGDEPTWVGTITALRLHFGADLAGRQYRIDFVEVSRNSLQELLDSSINGRFVEIEETLDATNATLTEKASQIQVTDHGIRLGSAESELEALGALNLSALSATIGTLQTTVTNAGIRLDAVTGQIVSILEQVQGPTDQLRENSAINATLNNYRNRWANRAAVARITESARVKAVEGTEAVAEARRALLVQLGSNYAEFIEEVRVRVTETTALGSRASLLEASVNTPDTGLVARVTNVELVKADLSTLNVVAGRTSTLEGQVQNEETGLLDRVTLTESSLVTVGETLEARWQILTDVDGRVRGIVFNDDGEEADLTLLLDNLFIAVASVNGGAPVVPFAVQSVAGVPTVVMGDVKIVNANIVNGAIDSAKIANLAVDSIQIKDAAVTVPRSYTQVGDAGCAQTAVMNTWSRTVTLPIKGVSGSQIPIVVNANLRLLAIDSFPDEILFPTKIYINGALVISRDTVLPYSSNGAGEMLVAVKEITSTGLTQNIDVTIQVDGPVAVSADAYRVGNGSAFSAVGYQR